VLYRDKLCLTPCPSAEPSKTINNELRAVRRAGRSILRHQTQLHYNLMEPNASKHAEEQNIICPVVELNRFIWIILNNAGIQAKWNIIKKI